MVCAVQLLSGLHSLAVLPLTYTIKHCLTFWDQSVPSPGFKGAVELGAVHGAFNGDACSSALYLVCLKWPDQGKPNCERCTASAGAANLAIY